MESDNLSIIIPTYNEEDNIAKVIAELRSVLDANQISFELLIIDDQSKDKTISIVENLSSDDARIRLVVRDDDPGLSQSVVEGIFKAKNNLIIVMDADLSHPPSKVIDIWDTLVHGFDIVVGSRYIDGGDIKNWPFKRHIISAGATVIARLIFPSIHDPVSGFFGFHRRIINEVTLKPRGYKILFELLGKGRWNTFTEVPFVFTEREKGSSKLNYNIITLFCSQFLDILIYRLFYSRGNME